MSTRPVRRERSQGSDAIMEFFEEKERPEIPYLRVEPPCVALKQPRRIVPIRPVTVLLIPRLGLLNPIRSGGEIQWHACVVARTVRSEPLRPLACCRRNRCCAKAADRLKVDFMWSYTYQLHQVHLTGTRCCAAFKEYARWTVSSPEMLNICGVAGW